MIKEVEVIKGVVNVLVGLGVVVGKLFFIMIDVNDFLRKN